MPLNPQDIVRKVFREAFRGYNQTDVDLFLDEVVEDFTRLAEENQKMKVRLAALQQEVARLREGRGVPASTPVEDPARVEAEARQRVRRFLEEQIRLIDAQTPSPTVERIARDAPKADEPELERSDRAERSDQPEPFWAGE